MAQPNSRELNFHRVTGMQLQCDDSTSGRLAGLPVKHVHNGLTIDTHCSQPSAVAIHSARISGTVRVERPREEADEVAGQEGFLSQFLAGQVTGQTMQIDAKAGGVQGAKALANQ